MNRHIPNILCHRFVSLCKPYCDPYMEQESIHLCSVLVNSKGNSPIPRPFPRKEVMVYIWMKDCNWKHTSCAGLPIHNITSLTQQASNSTRSGMWLNHTGMQIRFTAAHSLCSEMNWTVYVVKRTEHQYHTTTLSLLILTYCHCCLLLWWLGQWISQTQLDQKRL